MTSCHIPFQKGDKFWSRRPKKQAMKSAKPPSKKNKGKGKPAAAEPSEVDESQAGDALSEVPIRPHLHSPFITFLSFTYLSLLL